MVGSACTISETGYYLHVSYTAYSCIVNVDQPGTKTALLVSGIAIY